MPAILKIESIDEISLVDKGASGNEVSKPAIVIAKRKGAMSELTKDEQGLLTKLFQKLGFKKEGITKLTLDEALASLSEEAKAVVLDALAAAGKQPEKEMHPTPEGEKPTVEKPKEEEEMKAMPEEMKKRLESSEKETSELKKKLQALEDEKEFEGFLKQAQNLPFLAGSSTNEIAKTLRAAKKSLSKEEYESLTKVLTSANSSVEKSKLFERLGGTGGFSEDEPRGQLEKVAKNLIEKGIAKTRPEALKKALEQNPELYVEYKSELYDRNRS